MKKSLLTLGAVVGFAAGAFAQGSIDVETGTGADLPGFNSASSSATDLTYSDFITGTVTLQLFSQSSSADASLASQASTINSLAGSASTEQAAVAMLEADFVATPFGLTLGAETSANSFNVQGGSITDENVYTAGTSTTIPNSPSATVGEYAFLATYVDDGVTSEGVLVLNGGGPLEMGGGSNPAYIAGSTWPGTQNLLLAPVPEPTTLALAGLGGLSMLFLRRRKS